MAGVIDDVEEYDPVTDTWVKKAELPEPRRNAATAVLDGKIYVIGGFNKNDVLLRSVDTYDPIADQWGKKADFPVDLFGSNAVVVNGKIYMTAFSDSADVAQPDMYEYDSAADQWSKKADLPRPRNVPTVVAVDGLIYVIGGSQGFDPPLTKLSTVDIYDPKTDVWTEGVDLPTAQSFAAGAVVAGKIYVIGGAEMLHLDPDNPNQISTEYTGRVQVFDTTASTTSVSPRGKFPTTWGDVKEAR